MISFRCYLNSNNSHSKGPSNIIFKIILKNYFQDKALRDFNRYSIEYYLKKKTKI